MFFNIRLFFKRISRFSEYIQAVCVAFTVLVLLILFKEVIIFNFVKEKIQLTNLGLAVFSWLALQVGFSFGVYAFIMSKKDGVIDAVRKTDAMARFRRFLMHEHYFSMIVAFCTIPLIVIEINLYAVSRLYYIIIALWFSSFIYVFMCFFSIVRIFKKISDAEDKIPDK